MRETMRGAPGVGLAAPQIGLSLQLAVIEDRKEYHKEVTAEQLKLRERRPVAFPRGHQSAHCTARRTIKPWNFSKAV